MKVKKMGNRYHIRVEELLPCPDFSCIHELMSCAITTWCPDGCFDTNKYVIACIPKCMDCIKYLTDCEKWKKWKDKGEHSVFSEIEIEDEDEDEECLDSSETKYRRKYHRIIR